MDTFHAMRTFVRVVELGSFARAADRLALSTSAVSRQVADLENHLAARLLQRTTRRLSLTDAGRSFFERSVQLLADLEEAEGSVRAASVLPRGTLRMTCGVTFGVRYIAPLVAQFAAIHPQVVWDLDLSDRAVDLVDEGFDLAIRIGAIGHEGLIARQIGTTAMVPCASPRYLATHKKQPLRTPADLAAHACLTYTHVPVPNVWRFSSADGAVQDVRVKTEHRCNNGRMLAALACEGLGVVCEPDFIVAPEIAAGRLVRLLPRFRMPPSAITAVYPSRRHLSAKVRTLVDFLAKHFAKHQPWHLA